ncbi:hypothetical protein [Streptomyces clavifer]|uniref:hypothetical protein n=1 Tax=Streptomyces clavifer TaxID=68188 RepID=UPI003668C41D
MPQHYDAILVTEDRTVITINLPANPENFAEYAAAVLRCTTLEAFDLADGVTLWFDEDGARWPYNALIDELANWRGATNSFHGPVLITGYSTGVEPLPFERANRLLRDLSRADA